MSGVRTTYHWYAGTQFQNQQEAVRRAPYSTVTPKNISGSLPCSRLPNESLNNMVTSQNIFTSHKIIYHFQGRAIANKENYEMLDHFKTHIDNSTTLLEKLLVLQRQMCRKNNDRVGDDWVFWGSFQYCNTVITTLGETLFSFI